MLPKNLSKEEKKALLLKKYTKRDAVDVDDFKKFGVFWQPIQEKADTQKWLLITVCDTFPQAKEEIRWRAEFHKTNDGDLVLDNDKRFATFRDETQNKDKDGNTIEPEDIKADSDGNVISMGDMVDPEQIGDTLTESLPTPSGNFKSAGYYAGIELDYRGYYKIDEIYDITD